MASSAIDEDVTWRKKKRKREDNGLKLYVGKKVEIRSMDNGFQGSWHPGNVLSLDDILCSVQYDHLLSNGGLVPLIESFSTSSTDKGNFRGWIRPIPPQLEIEKWSLDYGLCVDVLHNDAWWEGVVFDDENGAEERRIFCPDLGDEMNVRIEMLRMTHDWDEVSEFWKPRGNWLFLELIEEYTQKLPLLVSVKQLWYDVREKKDFGDKICEWTFRWRTPWEDIVWQAIAENFRLSMDEIIDVMALKIIINLAHDVSKSGTINEYDCSEDVSVTEAVKNISQFVESHPDLNNSQALVPIANLSSSDGDVQMCNDACGHSPDIYFVQNGTTVRNPLDGLAGHGPYEEGDLFAQMLRNEKEISLDWDEFITPMEEKGTNNAGVYMKPHASLASHSNPSEFCSVDSIVNTTEVLRKFVGREDEAQGGLGQDFAIGQGRRSVSMKCTDGGITDLMNDEPIGNPTSSESNPPFCVRELGKISCRKDVAQEQVKAFQNSTDGCRRRNNPNDPQYKPPSSSSWLPAGPDILPRVEFCPSAISEYAYDREKGKHSPALALKVRMHLAYLGWKIKYRKDDVNRKCYISPDGVCYMSLVEVCRSLREPTREMLTLNSQDSWRNSSTLLDEQLDSGTQHISFLPFQQMKSDDCCNSLPYAESGALNLSEKKMSPVAYDTDIVVEPEYCPQAVVRWYERGLAEKRKVNNQSRSLKSNLLSLKAKKHLAAVGWRFWYAEKRGKWELRYTSPWGKCYYSLRTACKACMDKGGLSGDTITSQRLPESTDDKSEDVEILSRNLEEDYLDSTQSMMGNINVSDEYRGPLTGKMSSVIVKKGKISKDQIRERNNLDGSCPVPILRSSKRARQVVEPSTLHRNPRTVLSLLIDNNVVLPRARVRYIGKKNQLIMAEGRICRDGIKCSCCQKVFTLSGFEAHAGSNYHRPSARIFLEDGRSLLECQTQMVQNNNLKSSQTVSGVRTKGNQLHCDSDYICSICQYGGELVMCDRCPSTFHIHCLGLKDVPEGEWFCLSCCCGICGRSDFNENAELFTEKTVIYCDQCEHEYHVGCLRERELLKLESHPEGNFFCSKKCKEIFLGLLKLLGKSIPVGDNNLSWTILKSCKSDNYDLHNFDTDTIVEHHSKLNLALGVMHECFEPLKEPRTNRDLFEDVIFSRGSELNRLNFRGFYTVLLERKDELISVATVRVFGERVAEVPLVGTRVKYRRLGMCRILMNELEKTLMELGVERILLPAVPHVVNTWTTSFGFSRMTDSERLKFLDCTFLDFRDTIMCRKILLKNPVVESRTLLQLQDASFGCCDNIDLDRHSIGSEVIQAEEIEENEIMQQVPVDDASGN